MWISNSHIHRMKVGIVATLIRFAIRSIRRRSPA